MKAIVIDPFSKIVYEIADFDGELESFYKLLDCSMIEAVHFQHDNNILWVDEEGLFKEHKKYFSIGRYPQAICGRALLLADEAGECISTPFGVSEVSGMVKFLGGRSR